MLTKHFGQICGRDNRARLPALIQIRAASIRQNDGSRPERQSRRPPRTHHRISRHRALRVGVSTNPAAVATPARPRRRNRECVPRVRRRTRCRPNRHQNVKVPATRPHQIRIRPIQRNAGPAGCRQRRPNEHHRSDAQIRVDWYHVIIPLRSSRSTRSKLREHSSDRRISNHRQGVHVVDISRHRRQQPRIERIVARPRFVINVAHRPRLQPSAVIDRILIHSLDHAVLHVQRVSSHITNSISTALHRCFQMVQVPDWRRSLIPAQVNHVRAKIRIAAERRPRSLIRHAIDLEALIVAHHHALVKQSAAYSGVNLDVLQPSPVRLRFDRRILNRYPTESRGRRKRRRTQRVFKLRRRQSRGQHLHPRLLFLHRSRVINDDPVPRDQVVTAGSRDRVSSRRRRHRRNVRPGHVHRRLQLQPLNRRRIRSSRISSNHQASRPRITRPLRPVPIQQTLGSFQKYRPIDVVVRRVRAPSRNFLNHRMRQPAARGYVDRLLVAAIRRTHRVPRAMCVRRRHRDRPRRRSRGACPSRNRRRFRRPRSRNVNRILRARIIRSVYARRTRRQVNRIVSRSRQVVRRRLHPVVTRNHKWDPRQIVSRELRSRRLRNNLANSGARISGNIPPPASTHAPSSVAKQASRRIRRPRPQFARRNQSRNQTRCRCNSRVHILLGRGLQRRHRIRRQSYRPRHSPADRRQIISRSHIRHRRIHISLARHIASVHRRRHIRRNRKRLDASNRLAVTQVHHARQLRIHIQHRNRLRRRARSRRRLHSRQVHRRSRRHHPILSLHFIRPQLKHDRVIHSRRSRPRIRHQRHAERPIRAQRHLRHSSRHRLPARRHKRRPRDDQSSRRHSAIRQINGVRDGSRRGPTLRNRFSSESRNPKPASRDPHRQHPIKKPPHRAAPRVKHGLPP